jgi:hypothetical protein
LNRIPLLELRERLSTADHQTHRRYSFTVPEHSSRLTLDCSYAPKRLSPAESAKLLADALRSQRAHLEARVGGTLADQWFADHAESPSVVVNLVTVSLDDAQGAYRGARHRDDAEQNLIISAEEASPGLVAGPLPPGLWTLTLSAHTLVSDQLEVSIQIGAETA